MNINKYIVKTPSLLLIVASLLMVLIPVMSTMRADAAVNARFSITPSSKTLTVGENLVVYLTLDTGGNSVLAWKTALTYSTSAFSSVSVATDPSSHFTQNPVADVASGGTIKISRYATSASSTGGAMAKITLHSSGVGNTSLGFAHICSSTADTSPCSGVTNSTGTNLLSTITGSNITVAAAPVAASSSPAKAKKKSFLSSVADAVAGVISPSSEATASESGQTISRGSVRITVYNQKNKPLEGAKVTLAGKSGVTDKNGKVLLTDIYPGETKGTIVYKDKTQNITVDVQEGTSAYAPQLVNFTLDTGGSMLLPILFSIIALAVIIGLIDLIFISKGGFRENVDRLFHHGNGGGHASPSPGASSATVTKHTATKSHDRHDPMTPGLIVEPNVRGDDHDWKY